MTAQVSGLIHGETDAMPLHFEILYNEYNIVGAFAVAALLCLPALVNLALKTFADGAEPDLGRRAH